MTFTINADIIKWLYLILCIKASRNLKRRGGRDGLRRSIGNAVYVNSIPWVRIPSSPPQRGKPFGLPYFSVPSMALNLAVKVHRGVVTDEL